MICFDVSAVYVIERKIKRWQSSIKIEELTLILSYNIVKLFPNKPCTGVHSEQVRPYL